MSDLNATAEGSGDSEGWRARFDLRRMTSSGVSYEAFLIAPPSSKVPLNRGVSDD